MNHLDFLEAQAIYIIREAYTSALNPVMMYSIGKDSSVMLHLAKKAFAPGKIPFPLLHIDTTWKFKEMIAFRDKIAKENHLNLITYTNEEGIKNKLTPFTHGSEQYTTTMKTDALKQALNHYEFDVIFGGARRDEEKSRAKERIFSFRSKDHIWDVKNQRPEFGLHFNTYKNKGESVRVFPLSNFTEVDIWSYIVHENIPIVPLYYAKERPVIKVDGAYIMVDDERIPHHKSDIMYKKVRFRTLGCYPLTAAIESEADTLEKIIVETLQAKKSERAGRLIDNDTPGSMEKKKREGYF